MKYFRRIPVVFLSAMLLVRGADVTLAATTTVAIGVLNPTISEGGGFGSFNLYFSWGYLSDRVIYTLQRSGSATHGSDYTTMPASPSSTFTVIKERYQTGGLFVDVNPINDAIYESTENVVITILSAQVIYLNGNWEYADIVEPSATMSITDNDPPPPPTITISAPTSTAKESPQTKGKFRISRPPTNIGSPLTIYYTLGGSAIGPSPSMDYTLNWITATGVTGSSFVIPAGVVYIEVEVVPWYDGYGDSGENVRFTLSANAAYTVGSPGYADVTIND